MAALAGGGRNQGAGRSDLVGWMGTLRWVAAGSGGIPRKGVAAAGEGMDGTRLLESRGRQYIKQGFLVRG